MCHYRLLLLVLVLSALSYAFYFKGDVNVTSFKGLIKAIFLFKGVNNVFLIINCIKCFWLLIVRFFREKISKNYILRIFLSKGDFSTTSFGRLCRTRAAPYFTPLL